MGEVSRSIEVEQKTRKMNVAGHLHQAKESNITYGKGVQPSLNRMKNKIDLFIGGLVWVLCILGVIRYKDNLPPRTPYKIARVETQLTILNTFKVKEFEENYRINGSGLICIVFELNEKELENVVRECQKDKYKEVTIENLIEDGFLDSKTEYGPFLYKRNIREIQEGFYQLKKNSLKNMDFTITVIDKEKRELIVYKNIP